MDLNSSRYLTWDWYEFEVWGSSLHSETKDFLFLVEEQRAQTAFAAGTAQQSRNQEGLTTEVTEFTEASRNILLCGLRVLCGASFLPGTRRSCKLELQRGGTASKHVGPDPSMRIHE